MVITIIGILLIFVLLICTIYQVKEIRRNALFSLMQQKERIYTACAGSDDPHDSIPAFKEIFPVEHNLYKDSQGNVLDPKDYEHLIVQGESMQFCGIHNNDLIFVEPISDMGSLVFPLVLLLRKHQHMEKGGVEFKIRRTWMRCHYVDKDDLLVQVEEKILSSLKFQEVRQLDVYDGDTELLADLKNKRIPEYERKYIAEPNSNASDREIIVSTTFHTNEKKIRFSLHPVSVIKGKVIASFGIKGNPL